MGTPERRNDAALPAATLVDPAVEDGYLLLVGDRAFEEGAAW